MFRMCYLRAFFPNRLYTWNSLCNLWTPEFGNNSFNAILQMFANVAEAVRISISEDNITDEECTVFSICRTDTFSVLLCLVSMAHLFIKTFVILFKKVP